MTRFNELCSAYAEVNRQYGVYRTECMAFVGQLVTGLRQYLEAPDGFVSLYAKQGSFAGRKVDGPTAAMHLADDTFWHFGIALDLYEESGQLPYHCVGFDFRLKRVGNKFMLHVDSGPVFELTKENPDGFGPVYEYLFQFVKNRYQDSFSEFVLKGDSTRRFGF